MGPLFKLRLRAIVDDEFTVRGFSGRQIRKAVAATNEMTIGAAMTACSIKAESLPPSLREERPLLGVIGEIFKGIGEWLRSPAGQEFLAALFKILLGLLVGLSEPAIVVADANTSGAGSFVPPTVDAVFAESKYVPEAS